MLRILGFVIGILASLPAGTAHAEPISLHGSTTVMNLLVMPHKAEIEAISGQEIAVFGNGSQRGLADLVAGKAQIAMISAPLELEVGKLNEKRPGSIDPARLSTRIVGEARVAFAVHPSNPVRRVPVDRLVDILAGKIRNWQELGGPDQPIVIVTAQPGDGLRTLVESNLLVGRELAKDARAMTNATQITKVVAQLVGAVGIVTASSIDASVAELATDTQIAQPLILVTIGQPTPQIERVVEAVAKVGQL